MFIDGISIYFVALLLCSFVPSVVMWLPGAQGY